VPIPRGSDELAADEDPLDGDEQMPLEMHLPEEPVPPSDEP
jgi:segregation and condensation protein B